MHEASDHNHICILSVSVQAYQKWVREHGPERPLPGLKYTHEQLLFIAFAQVQNYCFSLRLQVKSLQLPLSAGATDHRGQIGVMYYLTLADESIKKHSVDDSTVSLGTRLRRPSSL